MTIALDATYSIGSELSGVGVYSREILYGLAALHPEQKFAWCYRPHRYLEGRRQPLPSNCRSFLMHDRVRVPRNRIFHGLNQRMPRRGGICTFHDLFVITGDYSTPEFRKRFTRISREAAARADLIIAVSQFTADQVHGLLGVERSRLRVVHHGVAAPRIAASKREPIVLHVGAIQQRKNVIRLIEAFEQSAPPPWRLILAGSAGHGSSQIIEHISGRIEHTGFLSAGQLEALYSKASIFAFPSLDEGFGMPVLEAMVRGIPVITSNRSALPEVAGDAALLVDPFRSDEIAGAIRRLINDRELGESLIRKGKVRAAEFTWKHALEKTWAIYQESR